MELRFELRLARALFQLTQYLESIRLPFTLQDLYLLTYGELWNEMPGALWLDHLAADPYVVRGLDEFYTLKTIFQTLEQAGLTLLLDSLADETARLGIGMGVISPGAYRRRPPQAGEDSS
ncbi:MAG: hypothetical protein ACXVP5_00315 [Tumebacillaceae bacterium]